MRNKPLFYIIGFSLLLINLVYFNNAYKTLNEYSAFIDRQHLNLSLFQDLSSQINNAAVINPDLLGANNPSKGRKLFFADSVEVGRQLGLLRSNIQDSTNSIIFQRLEGLIRSELSWLINSNVPDSIINNKIGRAHFPIYDY